MTVLEKRVNLAHVLNTRYSPFSGTSLIRTPQKRAPPSTGQLSRKRKLIYVMKVGGVRMRVNFKLLAIIVF